MNDMTLDDEIWILVEALRLCMPDWSEIENNKSLTQEQIDILRKAKGIIDEV